MQILTYRPGAAILLNLSTYFLTYWLFSSALTALLDRFYPIRQRFLRHLLYRLSFTTLSDNHINRIRSFRFPFAELFHQNLHRKRRLHALPIKKNKRIRRLTTFCSNNKICSNRAPWWTARSWSG